MANMSYCRWQNTSLDLRDCASTLEESDEDLSKDEQLERMQVFTTIADMLDALGIDVDINEISAALAERK